MASSSHQQYHPTADQAEFSAGIKSYPLERFWLSVCRNGLSAVPGQQKTVESFALSRRLALGVVSIPILAAK